MLNLNIFRDRDGSFSWRKGGTALCFFLFTYSVMGYTIKHGFDELPNSYLIIIGMVFTFYFGKTAIDNIGSIKKDNQVDKK